jgi:PilZ domain-containing protein
VTVSQFAYLESQQIVDERRSSPRKKLRFGARAASASGNATEVIVHDISATGLLIEGALGLSRGEQFDVFLPRQQMIRATVVWASGRFFGCQFVDPIPAQGAKAARSKNVGALPKRGSPEALSLAASQLRELSLAIDRIGWVLDRAIFQLSKRDR